jgi:hypothetical protein
MIDYPSQFVPESICMGYGWSSMLTTDAKMLAESQNLRFLRHLFQYSIDKVPPNFPSLSNRVDTAIACKFF